MPAVTLVTCAALPDGDEDAAVLVEALSRAGVAARWQVWNDPAADWSADLVVVRSPWDYTDAPEEFLQWTRSVPNLANPASVIEWSADLRVKRWSRQAEALFGWSFEEVRGRSLQELGFVHPDSIDVVAGLVAELAEGRERRNRMLARNLTRDGRGIWCEWYSSAFCDADGRTLSILAMAEDVTARVETLEQLQQAAVHDALTGLPNRNSLALRLEHAIRRVTRTGERLALLFIDLDRFKKVNDTLGHAAGDEVLRQSAARIRACVRDGDSLARLGGDEFVVLLENDVSPDVPGIIGERIRKAFESPFDWHGTDVRCGASIGVSLYPDHAGDPATLLASADEAMYRVKNAAE